MANNHFAFYCNEKIPHPEVRTTDTSDSRTTLTPESTPESMLLP